MSATMAAVVVAGFRYILPGFAVPHLEMTVTGVIAAFLLAMRLTSWAITHRGLTWTR